MKTRDLRLSDVPDVVDTWTDDVIQFALTFDGYKFMNEREEENYYAQFCNLVGRVFEKSPQILECFNATGLRCLLFFEQRRFKWTEPVGIRPVGAGAEELDRIEKAEADDWERHAQLGPYVRAILAQIRRRLDRSPHE